MDEPPKPQVYLPEQQLPASSLFLVARTQGGDPMTLLPLVRRELAALDPRSAVGDPTTLERIVSDSFARQRFSMTIMTVFAASALFLTVVGLYGVIVLSVNERRREIGVRMALGARSRDVLRMILGEGARIASIGIVLGLCGAFALSRVVRSMLFGVSATNPPSMRRRPRRLRSLHSWRRMRRRGEPLASIRRESCAGIDSKFGSALRQRDCLRW